ncbi:Zinc/iron permease [Ochromonadaceae sp. CCMP2298]|nr:Zinc/iron permease [Ochromonadaceae sp. CCMP2298]
MGLQDKELAFLLVCGAGLSTGIGAGVVYSKTLIQVTSKSVLAVSLGLSAGVMLYVSFVEIFAKSVGAFEDAGHAHSDAYLYSTLCFFGGILTMNLIDKLVHLLDPSHMNHDDIDFDMLEEIALRHDDEGSDHSGPVGLSLTEFPLNIEEGEGGEGGSVYEGSVRSHAEAMGKKKEAVDKKLHHMGLMTALAIAIHNFPEGLATFVATLSDPAVGAALAVAIAIHNVPEGLCVSVPIYFATNDRHKAFAWGFLSGLSEIVGAGLGWLILQDVFDDNVYAILFGVVAGMMINISLYQLIPTAMRYDPSDRMVSNAIVVGMAIMAISLVAFLY